jgi:hypothetical protein
MMLIGAFFPLLELFDRWDAPGFSNDTEFRVYALLFAICLVLLLCKLISSGALKFNFVSWPIFLRDERVRPLQAVTLSSLPSLRCLFFRYKSDLQRNAPAWTHCFGVSSR